MGRLSEIRRRLQFFSRRNELDSELEEEMRFHLEMKARRNRENGMPEDEAYYAARRQFGNATRQREDSREAWGWSAIERFAKDVQISLRVLRRDAGFTALAVLTLGLGIGATTAIFSVINGVLLRPLPYKDPDRLVAIWQSRKQSNVARTLTSYPNFQDWREQSRSFDGMTAASIQFTATLTEPEPDVLDARGVDRGFFKTLGIQVARGRVFLEEDFKPGRESVALLSWAAWELRFGRDPNILGRKVRANGQVRTIVGVLPQWYRHPAPAEGDKPPEFWIPMDFSGIKARQAGVLTVIARLKPEVSAAEARSEMAGIGRRLAEQYAINKGSEIEVTPLADVLVSKMRRPLWLLLGAVLVLLLCACVNMANLLLARSVQRQREFAIRAVLGGRRGLLFGR